MFINLCCYVALTMRLISPFRKQYASWKEECKKMFPVIGSGSFITAPVVTENGQPNLDPLVIQEINLGKKKKR